MNYQKSLDYLYGLQRFGIKLGLDNMHALVERLPLLQPNLPSVHVAGTNGKGSVSALLAEIMRCSGLRVGLYTSPHLHCFTERINIEGLPISKAYAAELTATIRIRSEGIPLTFFEATTAMALLAFQQQKLDIAVIETGLGGRLDATNVIHPLLSVITPVSFDHQQHLGDSLVAIAAEKAGIIKPETPVVVGCQTPEVSELIESVARAKGAKTIVAQRDYAWNGDHHCLTVSVDKLVFPGLSCVLEGGHQLDNYAQAIAAAVEMKGMGVPVTEQAIRLAGRVVHWPARLEWWGEGRRILLDAAHNVAGVRCLATYLEQQGYSKVKIVLGLSGERDPAEVLQPLCDVVDELFIVPVPDVASVPPEMIKRWATAHHVRCRDFPSPKEGLFTALAESSSAIPVVVCGSIYLVSALKTTLQNDHIELSALTDSVA